MMKMFKALLVLFAVGITGTIVSCVHESDAHGDAVTQAELDTAIASAISELQTNEIDPLKEKTAHIVTFAAGAPNPVQIAPMYDVYFDGPDCTGQAYVRGFGSFADFVPLGEAAIRQGIAFRYTLPGQADEMPETYAWLEPGTEAVEPAIVTHLWAPGKCSNIDDSGEPAYPVQQQVDPEAYELLTGVPAGGFLEGTAVSSFAALEHGGLMGSRFYDTVTSTGFYIRFDATAEPLKVLGGSK